jgi:hypothetical protein
MSSTTLPVASTEAAACCAVIFFHRLTGVNFATGAQAELKNWNTVYGEKEGFTCETWKIAGSECLVMPYLKSVKADERHQLLEDGTISKALTEFAKSWHIHRDIKWRHFGWFGDELLLYDLGVIKKSTTAERKSWHEASIALLKRSAGTNKQPKKRKITNKRKGMQQKRSDGSGTKRTRTQSENRGQLS